MIRGHLHAADHIERELVFRRELAVRGLAVDEELVIDGQARHDVADQELRTLLRRRTDMDAVVTTDDYIAVAAMEAVTGRGLRVPEDVAVTGFDNYPTGVMTWPGITTVDQNLPDQGRVAAELLLAQADGDRSAARVEVPCTLVVRGSTVPAEGGVDEQIRTAVRITRTATGHSRAQDAIVGMSRDLLGCRSLDDVGGVLADRAASVGLTRCFLVAFDPVSDPAEDDTARHSTSRLVADYRDGRAHVPDPERFSSCRLLPGRLESELGRDLLVYQPLYQGDRVMGYVLYDHELGEVVPGEALRVDLNRMLGHFLTRQELRNHATTLERLVARRQEALAGEVANRRRAQEDLQRANGELERLARIDGLTQIANRSAFQAHLDQHWRATRRDNTPLALVMVDLDHFKAYNDRYGHLQGDAVLRVVAGCLAAAAQRPTDLACRFGGEEFALLLPRTGLDAAYVVVERFRRLLDEADIPHGASPVAEVVTASCGIAVTSGRSLDRSEHLIDAADKALYQAKADGRDLVVHAPESDDRVAESA